MNWLRYCRLTVGNQQFDLSNLRIRFYVRQAKIQTRITGEIRVYNLAKSTVAQLVGSNPFESGTGGIEGQLLQLDAGYIDNHGLIYQGNVVKCQAGRETPLDTFVDFYVRDGDTAYNHGVINKNFAPGSTQQDHVKEVCNVCKQFGVTQGTVKGLSQTPYPRSVSLYGPIRDVMRTLAHSNNASWYINNMQLCHVPLNSQGSGGAIMLNENTGMIGMPQAVQGGVNVTALINPAFQLEGTIQLDASEVNPLPWTENIDTDVQAGKAGIAGAFDGTYVIQSLEWRGDTRGQEWYANITAYGIQHGPGIGTENIMPRYNGAGG